MIKNDPLTAPKPVDSLEWVARQSDLKAFYDAFRAYLMRTASLQHGVAQSTIESIIDASGLSADGSAGDEYDGMFEEERTPEKEAQAKRYEMFEQLTAVPLEIRGIHFPPVVPAVPCDFEKLLKPFSKFVFVECHFYGTALFADRVVEIHFDDCVFHSDWSVTESHAFDESKPLFDECKFHQKVIFDGDKLGPASLRDYNGIFGGIAIEQLVLTDFTLDVALLQENHLADFCIRSIKINRCKIEAQFIATRLTGLNVFECKSTVFSKKLMLHCCQVGHLRLIDTNCEGLASFYESNFHEVLARKCLFSNQALFVKCRFGSDQPQQTVAFEEVTFESSISFRKSEFYCPLSMRSTDRQGQPNFLDTTFTQPALAKMDRETFRIIKHSFDSVGNRIEANKYFAHEMDAYRRELRDSEGRAHWTIRWERLLLWMNATFSCHGQSYPRALLWLGGTIIASGTILACYEVASGATQSNMLTTLGGWLNTVAMGFLPLRPLMADREHLAFFILAVTALISVFIWHLLVALRRHSKR